MRENIADIKGSLDEYRDFKKQHMFLGRRERNIKAGWRHGITGVENADSENCSAFFQD
jgi:hypothetical protein